MVVPGRYAVRLEAGGRAQTQAFDLLPDPRVAAGARPLAEQLAFLKQVLGRLATVNRTINEIDGVSTTSDGEEPYRRVIVSRVA